MPESQFVCLFVLQWVLDIEACLSLASLHGLVLTSLFFHPGEWGGVCPVWRPWFRNTHPSPSCLQAQTPCLPSAVLVDLDYTCWPFWLDYHASGPPFRPHADGITAVDRRGRQVWPFLPPPTPTMRSSHLLTGLRVTGFAKLCKVCGFCLALSPLAACLSHLWTITKKKIVRAVLSCSDCVRCASVPAPQRSLM